MKHRITGRMALPAALALLASAASAAPDISGTYWATSYSPKIQVMGVSPTHTAPPGIDHWPRLGSIPLLISRTQFSWKIIPPTPMIG